MHINLYNMKRRSKKKTDLANQIIKGMAKNEEKVVKDSFTQRLKTNIARNYIGQDVEMDITTLTNYLNNIVKKGKISIDDVKDEYDKWCKHDWERNKIHNPVIDRMLYKGIKRLEEYWNTK